MDGLGLSAHVAEPISTRNSTDLDAELDRSQRVVLRNCAPNEIAPRPEADESRIAFGMLGRGCQGADVVAHPVDLVLGAAIPSLASIAFLNTGELGRVHPFKDCVHGASNLVEVVAEMGAVTVGGGIDRLLSRLSGSLGPVPDLGDLRVQGSDLSLDPGTCPADAHRGQSNDGQEKDSHCRSNFLG